MTEATVIFEQSVTWQFLTLQCTYNDFPLWAVYSQEKACTYLGKWKMSRYGLFKKCHVLFECPLKAKEDIIKRRSNQNEKDLELRLRFIIRTWWVNYVNYITAANCCFYFLLHFRELQNRWLKPVVTIQQQQNHSNNNIIATTNEVVHVLHSELVLI